MCVKQQWNAKEKGEEEKRQGSLIKGENAKQRTK